MNETIVHQYQLLYKAFVTTGTEDVNYEETLMVIKISAGQRNQKRTLC